MRAVVFASVSVCVCVSVCCYLKAGALLTHRSRTTIGAKSGGACGNIGSPLAGMYLWKLHTYMQSQCVLEPLEIAGFIVAVD